MNRKLHNTTLALIASSSLFVLGLLTASPATAPAPEPALAAAASFDADRAVASEAVEGDAGSAAAAPRRHARRVHRQSVAMPFFSFAPRG
jgi:hypothetical protein